LDVARFKYPPHWVPLSLVFEAMIPTDPDTGRSRGFIILTNGGNISKFCRFKAGTTKWKKITDDLWKKLPEFIKVRNPQSLFEVVESFLVLFVKNDFMDFFSSYEDDLFGFLSVEDKIFFENICKELHQTNFYKLVFEVISSTKLAIKDNINKDLLTIILLAISRRGVEEISNEKISKEYLDLLSVEHFVALSSEVKSISEILRKLTHYCC